MAPATCPADRPNRTPRSDSTGTLVDASRQVPRTWVQFRPPPSTARSAPAGRAFSFSAGSELLRILNRDERRFRTAPGRGRRRRRRRPEYEPVHPGSGREPIGERLKRWLGPIGAGALLIATKLKAALLLLPKLKCSTTSGTMLVSIAAYALIWGWTFAVGFVALLFLHEIGHVIQLRREGIKASAPMFIPFLGAVVTAKSMGDDAAAEARVGLAGPVLGTLATLVPLGDLAGDRQRVLAGARLRRLLPQPLQPAAGAAARRRPGDGRAFPWVWLAAMPG